ncbi:conserved hypothetical protein [Methanococcus vannielii SB]|uniref:DUF4350 domain-containing protein n=1 Tax=Methanococcus vannielii (strain ATCC 35089 / DSM 1224 / JCM 13029 / OCM 148 / SB) TaxID=406327 RepID=A6UNN0_METVS|nr:DUF4350 domain-containing protein [Methanococcus vannielii]ABR54102.1 conserved hypothetical protein [Methanococcus vannielii SB]
MEKYFKYLLILVLGITLLSLPAGIPVLKSYNEYSSFNSNLEGCSKFTKLIYNSNFEVTPILSPYDDYNFDKNGVIFIIKPELDFSLDETLKIKQFIESGNILVISDDFGSGNNLLEKLNVSERFTKGHINDIFYIKNENIIEIKLDSTLKNDKLNDFNNLNQSNSILTYYPTSIRPSKYSNVILTTSNVSSLNKRSGVYPVMLERKYGNGKIIMISDPDIFTNRLYNHNEEFLKEFLNKVTLNGVYKTIYLDEIHRKDFNFEISVYYIQKSVPKKLVLALIIITIFLFQINGNNLVVKSFNKLFSRLFNKFSKFGFLNYIFSKVFENNKLNEDEILEKVSKEHEIDVDELKRVINNIKDGKNGRKRVFK